ncbi:MAG: redox-sensing transcriptional repressor Rex [Desulfovibrionales bacterium]|nr:redox-sensing transcriptional repressor Rex [Desulfovibrionales bacterium]
MTHKRRRQPKADKKDLIIRRLSVYLRTLDHLKGKGVEVVSSSDLEKIEGVTQSLVRRDLANFGTFGVRGVGYPVPALREQIARILGCDRLWNVVLIGAGGFGSVLLHSESFQGRNLQIVQIFDNDPQRIGKSLEGIPVHDMAQLDRELDARRVDIAIIAVPPPEVQRIVNQLGQMGIRGALYFASRPVTAPENMVVLNVDITIELGVLTHHLS